MPIETISAEALARLSGTSFIRVITAATTLGIAPSIIRVPVGNHAKKPSVGFLAAEGRRIVAAIEKAKAA